MGRGIGAVACMALWLAVPAAAQDDAGPLGYSYATYYVCDMATQSNMDNIVQANDYEVFDRWVEDGKLLAWGYLSHFTGGRWRRVQYHVSPTLEEALAAQATIFREIYEDNRAGGQARAEACEAHDDYVWALLQGSGPGTDRGAVSLSAYFVCDIARENRADEIVEMVQAPKLAELVAAGRIASWGWSAHRLGGEYRRLQVITGTDYASVMAARAELLQNANENHRALATEFANICNSHTDYLWDIEHEAP